MGRTKGRAPPEVIRKGRMDTLKKLNGDGRRLAVHVLQAQGVDTHGFDGAFDLISQDIREMLFSGSDAFYGAWEHMLSGPQADETFDKLYELIYNNPEAWKAGCGPGQTGGM